jgi:hypothetical protein
MVTIETRSEVTERGIFRLHVSAFLFTPLKSAPSVPSLCSHQPLVANHPSHANLLRRAVRPGAKTAAYTLAAT